MASLKIQKNQTGIDVGNNTYANQDNISTLYLDNLEFDVNLMQPNLEVEYTKGDEQVINDISNNNYIFKNGNVEVFTSLMSIVANPGEFNVSFDIEVLDLNTNISYFPDFLVTNLDNNQSIIGSGETGGEQYIKPFEPINTLI